MKCYGNSIKNNDSLSDTFLRYRYKRKVKEYGAMVENIKDQIEILVKLQDIETEKSKLLVEMDNVSKQIEVLDLELDTFKKKVEEDELSIKELNKNYRSYESDLEANQTLLTKSQEKLDSVTNNKEYQSILKEIDDIKSKNSQIEDKMIECLQRVDEAEEKLESTQQEYVQLSEKNKIEKESVHNHLNQGKKKTDDLTKEWDTVSKMVDPDMMEQYLALKEKIKGSVIAPVNNSVCDGCHMNIPPQMYNELQRFDSLKYCPFCYRMIYWKN